MSHQNCIVCGSKYFEILKGFESQELVKCKSCRLVFDKRIPSNSELIQHYTNYPRLNELPPITVKRYDELLDKLEKFRSTNNLIDLGCSNGLFLQCAQKRGWQVYGTEFDPDCIKINAEKGIKVFKADDLDPQLFKINFDVVTSFEVFEHINDPLREMQLVNSLLRRGGALYITTPNFNSISRFYLGNKWNIIEYPEHLTYYSPYTLNKMVRCFGYDLNTMATTGFSISRFKMSLAKNDASSEKSFSDEELRNKIESKKMLSFAKIIINHLLTYFYCGDAMKAFYIRK